MFTQKYQTQQKRMGAPGMYITTVTPLGREDVAKQLKNNSGNELGLSIIQMVYCIIIYLPFLICD